MAPATAHEESLRPGRPELRRLGWALAISLAIHLFCYGGYEVGKEFHLAQKLGLSPWLKKIQKLAQVAAPPPQAKPGEPPLVFVDVSPEQAAPEAPKNAKYYSSRNSVAANPKPDADTDVPKITGKQTQVAKAEDTERAPRHDQLQPDFKALEKQREQERAKPESPKPVGDLTMAKPQVNLRPDTGTAEHSRPRTIAEALRQRNQLVGEKMKQDGGVGRLRLEASFDAKATPFGAYDAAFIEIVQSRWYDLLDNISFDGYRRGKVTVEFKLHFDGQITDLTVVNQDVGTMLTLMCEKAVQDPSPYDKWPREMRLMVDKDYRDITFTFYYN